MIKTTLSLPSMDDISPPGEGRLNRSNTIIDHNDTLAVDEVIKELALREIVDFAKKMELRQLHPDSIEKMAKLLKKRSNIKEAKYTSKLGRILKAKNILSNGLAKRGFRTTASAAKEVAEDLIAVANRMKEENKKPKFNSSRSLSKDSSFSDCGSLSKDELLISGPVEPIVYIKGETKTKDLVPTEKRILGKGKSGYVHQHRTNSSLVVKKSLANLEQEYEIGSKLRHANLVKVHRLYIKEYPDKMKYKLVMDKIDGPTISHYYSGESKLSDNTVKKVLKQAQDCCMYLFDQKIAWSDVNNGNIFIQDTQDLMLADFGNWRIFENSEARALQLLMGAMEIVGWVIKSSSVRVEKIRNTEIEQSVIYPKEYFGEQIKLIQILSIFGANIHNNRPWMQKIKAKIDNKSDKEIKSFLKDYFAHVIKNFTLPKQNSSKKAL